jgi:hypothetical protein
MRGGRVRANRVLTRRSKKAPLFDHLVGGERARRNCEAEGLGGLEVDYKLELDWRLDRKVLDALQICSVFEKPPGCL